jgi:hypothetical protein
MGGIVEKPGIGYLDRSLVHSGYQDGTSAGLSHSSGQGRRGGFLAMVDLLNAFMEVR